MGMTGIDPDAEVILHAGIWVYCLRRYQTVNDEMSTMTFEDLMDFVGADYAVAA